MIDGGAFMGDSASVLLHHYSPSKVVSFDVSPINYNLYMQTMIRNRFDASKFTLHMVGLSDSLKMNSIDIKEIDTDQQTSFNNGTFQVMMTDLDNFMNLFYPNQSIGFIKTDLEGSGIEALKGMKETIRKHRPVLSLAIYHNGEEMFETIQLLGSFVHKLHYRMEILRLHGGMDYFGEVVLFAYPEELGPLEENVVNGFPRQ